MIYINNLFIFLTILLIIVLLIYFVYRRRVNILSLDDKNNLVFTSKYNNNKRYKIFVFNKFVKLDDIMTGIYYAPGLISIKCETEEKFKYWKNKLNSYNKIFELQNKEIEKYRSYIENKTI